MSEDRTEFNEGYSKGFIDGRDHARHQLSLEMIHEVTEAFDKWRQQMLSKLIGK